MASSTLKSVKCEPCKDPQNSYYVFKIKMNLRCWITKINKKINHVVDSPNDKSSQVASFHFLLIHTKKAEVQGFLQRHAWTASRTAQRRPEGGATSVDSWPQATRFKNWALEHASITEYVQGERYLKCGRGNKERYLLYMLKTNVNNCKMFKRAWYIG